MLPTLTKWPLRYLVVVELIYLLYEVLLAKNPGHDSPALVLGLLLAAATMPSGAVLYYLAAYVGDWLGLQGGDSKEFLPRFAAFQACIVTNAAFVAWLAFSSKKKGEKHG